MFSSQLAFRLYSEVLQITAGSGALVWLRLSLCAPTPHCVGWKKKVPLFVCLGQAVIYIFFILFLKVVAFAAKVAENFDSMKMKLANI